jgi:hypothetical protein
MMSIFWYYAIPLRWSPAMSEKEPPPPIKTGFSRQFDDAMIETLLTEALVVADGWSLAQFVEAPLWLKDLYTRHATAAHLRMQKIEETESNIKPSDHK